MHRPSRPALLRARQLIAEAIALLHPTPDDKYLKVESISGEVPGILKLDVRYYNRPVEDD